MHRQASRAPGICLPLFMLNMNVGENLPAGRRLQQVKQCVPVPSSGTDLQYGYKEVEAQGKSPISL